MMTQIIFTQLNTVWRGYNEYWLERRKAKKEEAHVDDKY